MADPKGEIFDDVVVEDKKTLLKYLRLPGTHVVVVAELFNGYVIDAEMAVEELERELAKIEVTEEEIFGDLRYYAVWSPGTRTLALGKAAVESREEVLRLIAVRGEQTES